MTEDILKALDKEEAEIVFQRFDAELAWQAGRYIRRELIERKTSAAIEISFGGKVLFSVITGDAEPDLFVWIARKRAIVERFQRSSRYLGARAKVEGYDFYDAFRVDKNLFLADGGGFPIRVAGMGVLGCVAVSGLSSDEDHDLIVESLRKLVLSQ